MKKVSVVFCNERYNYYSPAGEKHVFLSLQDANRWLAIRELVVDKVIKCKLEKMHSCCSKMM